MSGPSASSSLIVFLSESLVRAFVWLVTRLFYPLRVRGLENLPRQGGVLLVSNHVSYVDWLLLTAAVKRPVRFLISKEFYEPPWLKPFVSVARVIPIPSGVRPHEVVLALRRCGDAIRDGDVVCVFAEGGITRTGYLMPFQRGFETIMKDVGGAGNLPDAPDNLSGAADGKLPSATGRLPVPPPIIPVALDGVWGSIFSFDGGKFFWKWPKRLRRSVTVNFSRPLPPDATADTVHAAVSALIHRENAEP